MRRAVDEGELSVAVPARAVVTVPGPGGCGDYATNIALQLARPAGRPPLHVAQVLRPHLTRSAGVADVEITGPGFLNIRLDRTADPATALVREIRAGEYGHSDALAGQVLRFRIPYDIRAEVVADALVRIVATQGGRAEVEHRTGATSEAGRAGRVHRAHTSPPSDGGRAEAEHRTAAGTEGGSAERVHRASASALADCEPAEVEHRTAATSQAGRVGRVHRAPMSPRSDGGPAEVEHRAPTTPPPDCGPAEVEPDATPTPAGTPQGAIDAMPADADHPGHPDIPPALSAPEPPVPQAPSAPAPPTPINLRPLPAPEDPTPLGGDAARWALLHPAGRDLPRVTADHLVQRAVNPLFRVRYAHARTRALGRNAARLGFTGTPGDPQAPDAAPLLRALADHPQALRAAATQYAPDRLARHLVVVADAVLGFQHTVLPLGDEKPSAAHRARLALAEAAGAVLAGGLSLLGISAPDYL
ncbi:ArgS-related anticodon-binding protein NrtL [Streptomyces sp. NPDC005301]|uniref:ArgS-related anticodon-binding protein NrtL n=1 Tax=Streptomyces sp. NPDC005301 TaxID=3156874 RepID=UPI0033B64985